MTSSRWIRHVAGDRGRDAAGFLRAFVGFARWRAAAAAGLLALGAMADGIGLLLLVPILAIVTGSGGGAGRFVGSLASRLRAVDQTGRLLALLGLFAALMFARAAILAARDRAMSRLQLEFVESIRLGLIDRLVGAGWMRVTRVSHARVMQALSVDIHQVGIAANWATLAMVALTMLAANMVLALLLSPPAGALALALAIAGMLASRRYLGHADRLGRAVTEANLGLTRGAMAYLAGLKLALAQGLERRFHDEQAAQSRALVEDRLTFLRFQIAARNVTTTLAGVTAAGTLFAGVALFHVAPSVLLALLVVLSRMHAPALVVQQATQHVLHNLAAFRAIEGLERELGPTARRATVRVDQARPAPGPIVLDRVSFRHATGGGGLHDVSLTIAAGAFVGICGPSGSGKTTFVDLVAGLLTPQSGRIEIAGQAPSATRCGLAYVAQEPFMVDDTIRRNLGWFGDDIDEARLWDSLDRVGAGAWVRRLDHGLDTRIGERGTCVSAGERQQLALARALLRRPALLVLDEATNAIDVAGERRILEELAAMAGATTVLLIAHRRESLVRCDMLLRFPGPVPASRPDAQKLQLAPTTTAGVA